MTVIIATVVVLAAIVALLHTGDGLDYRTHEVRVAQAERRARRERLEKRRERRRTRRVHLPRVSVPRIA